MRIWHFSDTHLGHQQYHRTGADGLNQREQDIYRAFHAVIDQAVEERPDLVLHAGDLFDGVRPSNRALSQALEGFLKLDRAGIPVVVIAGNHEHPKLRETGSPFRLFEHLENVHPVYKGRAEVQTFATPDGEITVHAVPQCADAQTLAAEVEGLERQPGKNILMLHGAVHSIPAFSHAEFHELSLDPSWFDDRFDYVALGHYHRFTEVTTKAWYSGAPERVSMAEAGEEKGFLEVTLEDGLDVTFRPLPGRAYLDLPRIDATGLDADQVASAAENALEAVPQDAVVRLRIHDLPPTLRGVLDLARIRKAGAHALHLDLRLEWADQDHHVRGAVEIGGLAQEFEAFVAHHPVEGLDRDRLLTMARDLLADVATQGMEVVR